MAALHSASFKTKKSKKIAKLYAKIQKFDSFASPRNFQCSQLNFQVMQMNRTKSGFYFKIMLQEVSTKSKLSNILKQLKCRLEQIIEILKPTGKMVFCYQNCSDLL